MLIWVWFLSFICLMPWTTSSHRDTPSPSNTFRTRATKNGLNNTLRINIDCNSKNGLQQHTQNQTVCQKSSLTWRGLGNRSSTLLRTVAFWGCSITSKDYPVLEQSVQTVFKRQVAQLVTRTGLVGWNACYRLRLTFTILQINQHICWFIITKWTK